MHINNELKIVLKEWTSQLEIIIEHYVLMSRREFVACKNGLSTTCSTALYQQRALALQRGIWTMDVKHFVLGCASDRFKPVIFSVPHRNNVVIIPRFGLLR